MIVEYHLAIADELGEIRDYYEARSPGLVISFDTVQELRAWGHDVRDIRGTGRQGMFDDELWSPAQADQRTQVTTDRGFSENRDEQHYAILVVRLRQPNEQGIHARIMAGFRQFSECD
jgi:hypothetical protein